jgi:hypothetical protein
MPLVYDALDRRSDGLVDAVYHSSPERLFVHGLAIRIRRNSAKGGITVPNKTIGFSWRFVHGG